MLFHSQLFLVVFLPLAFLAYVLAARLEPRFGATPRKLALICASLVFYAYWDVRLAPVLIGSVAVNWLFARLAASRPIARHGRRGGRTLLPARGARTLLIAGIVVNLAVLGAFKYADFFAGNLAVLFGADHVRWDLALPLGISFFTFQQISYLADRARDAAPRYGLADYALYVTFFPQLIAGPIVRHDELIAQFARPPLAPGAAERIGRGLTWLAIGLVKKVFLADGLAEIVDPIFAQAGEGGSFTFADSWLAAIGFTLQIYFDFSGYSDMALGLALMFGFHLPINFNAPYRAWSVGEFWRRWHMTLSRFLRDYVYFPLGGSRHGAWRAARNLMITMLLSGLWHGAAWTFVAWGGLHGAVMAGERFGRLRHWRLPRLAGWALTFLFVMATFVLFRASSFAEAGAVYGHMLGLDGLAMDTRGDGRPIVILLGLAVVLLAPTSQRLVEHWLRPSRLVAAAVGVALVAALLQVGIGANQEFIYFQF